MSDVFDTDHSDKTTSALEELVGEGKKFADAEALAKGKLESDNFIEQLKKEKQEALEAYDAAKKEAGKQATIADLIKEIRNETQQSPDRGNQSLSDEDFQEKVRSIVRGDLDSDRRNANRERGNELVLRKVDGNVEAAKAFVAERAKELGTTPSKLRELSEESPAAFAKVMELGTSTAPASIASLQDSGVNTQNLNSAKVEEVQGHKTKAYYDRMKKEMGVRKYLDDHKLQNKMMEDAIALGERFNN